MRDYLKFYIDGKWVEPSEPKTLEVINPATEAVCGHISLGSAADVDRAVNAALKAFETFSRTSREERLALLERIVAELEKRHEDMAKAITEEMGAPVWLAQRAQAAMGAAHFRTAIEVLKSYRFEERRDATTIVKEPIGVCGFITPWNWPLNQIACKVAPALATGCTMVLKPSEIAPFSAMVFAEVLEAAGVAAGRVQPDQWRRTDRRARRSARIRASHGVVHGLDARRRRGREERRSHRQARLPGARRQEPEHPPRGRRHGDRRRGRRQCGHAELRSVLQCADAHARATQENG